VTHSCRPAARPLHVMHSTSWAPKMSSASSTVWGHLPVQKVLLLHCFAFIERQIPVVDFQRHDRHARGIEPAGNVGMLVGKVPTARLMTKVRLGGDQIVAHFFIPARP